jgi:3-deoxy-D-manno-octulosonic-acid transferase
VSPLLRLYLAFSRVSDPLWRLVHRRRLARGKEVRGRLPEKYGIAPVPRPDGMLLWFHALSVGESLALVPVIERALADFPDAHVLLTTSTATSAEALGKAALPKRCLHVLLPIDTSRAVRRFLDYWHPNVAVFAELDFWPRLMIETHRQGIRMVLVNSRMPEKSFVSRSKLGGMMRDILGLFDRVLLQDPASFKRFKALGADPKRMMVVGALKAAARPLPADQDELAELKTIVAMRSVWLAAATWHSEVPIVAAAHLAVLQTFPDALLIIAPRNPTDGDAAEVEMRRHFKSVSRRSLGQSITANTQVYIADTIGEMGLWYRLAPISFIGHSIDTEEKKLEGKNPFEAAALDSAIIHGPSVSYFEESYQALTDAGAAVCVFDSASLAAAVIALQDDARRSAMLKAAVRVIAERRGILENTWRVVREEL